jgi:hypothetical protein
MSPAVYRVRRLRSSSLASQFARPTPSCQVQPAFDVDGHLLTSSERETGSTRSGARKPVSLRHAYQSAPKNPAMSAANSSGASAAAKWPPRGMGVQRWMS